MHASTYKAIANVAFVVMGIAQVAAGIAQTNLTTHSIVSVIKHNPEVKKAIMDLVK